MAEKEFTISINETDHTFSGDDIRLYTFAGDKALYNHVFLKTRDEAGRQVGQYVFSFSEGYEMLRELVVENELPQMLFQRDVPDCDIEEYDYVTSTTLDTVEDMVSKWRDEG